MLFFSNLFYDNPIAIVVYRCNCLIQNIYCSISLFAKLNIHSNLFLFKDKPFIDNVIDLTSTNYKVKRV